MENKELPSEMLAKAAKAMRADAGYEGNGGLLDDCDYYARQAETALLAADVPGLLAALGICEEKFDAIYARMGGDECDGWSSPEDVWQLALDGRTEARRVLEKEATDGTN